MKKLGLILVTMFLLGSCSINDDDSPNLTYELAQITDNDLPDSFELGKSYTVTVSYVLPSQCNTFAGIDARRESNAGDERRNIYVAAVSQLHNGNNCDQEMTGSSGTSTFTITIDENEDYTFYFWTGTSGTDQPTYDQVIVPVTEIE